MNSRKHPFIEEVRESNDEIKSYLAGQIRQLLTKGEFLDALPGYLPPDQASLGHVTKDGILDMKRSKVAYFNVEDTDGLLVEFVEPRED